MKLNTRSATYGVFILTLSNVFTQVVGFAYRVLLARLIDAEGMGLFSLLMPAYSVIMSVIASGFTVAVSRLSSAYDALGNTRAVHQLVRRAIYGFLFLWCALAAVVFCLSDGISVWLLGDARTQTGLLLLMPCILFTGLENIHKNHFYGLKRVMPPAVSEAVEILVRSGAVLLLIYLVKPPYEEYMLGLIVLGMILCEIGSASLLRLLYRREKREKPSGGPGVESRQMLRDVAAIAIPISAANTLGSLISSANSVIIPSRLIVSGLTSSEALSSYGVIVGMTMPLLSLPIAFIISLSLVMIPRLSEDLVLSRFESMRRRVLRTLRATTLGLIPSMTLIVIFGPNLAALLFKQASAGSHMTLLAIGTVLSCYQGILGSLLSGMGEQKRTAANAILSGALQLILTWFWAASPDLRIRGFVYAYVAASVFGAVLCALDLMRFFKKNLTKSFALRTL